MNPVWWPSLSQALGSTAPALKAWGRDPPLWCQGTHQPGVASHLPHLSDGPSPISSRPHLPGVCSLPEARLRDSSLRPLPLYHSPSPDGQPCLGSTEPLPRCPLGGPVILQVVPPWSPTCHCRLPSGHGNEIIPSCPWRREAWGPRLCVGSEPSMVPTSFPTWGLFEDPSCCHLSCPLNSSSSSSHGPHISRGSGKHELFPERWEGFTGL